MAFGCSSHIDSETGDPLMLIRLVAVFVVWIGISLTVSAETLESVIQPLVAAHRGTVGVAIKHLPSGESYAYQADMPLATASLIKLPVMITAYDAMLRGDLDLTKMVTLHDEDKVPGSGVLSEHFSAGMQMPLKDAMRLMIVYSDNTATNLVVDQIGLPATADLMEKLGCPNTKLHAKVYRGDTSIFPERSQKFGLGSTTAGEMVSLLQRLDHGDLVSAKSSKEMIDLLFANTDRTMLLRDLPPSVKVAHKSGAVSNVRTDAGLIDAPNGRIAICVLTSDNEDQSWGNENEAHLLIGRIARAAFDYFNPDGLDGASDLPKQLATGSTGELVEALQRTLNARLTPSMNIAADGDFGPMTQKAVTAFQRQSGLKETGVVDPATWQALGTLITEEAPVADPDVVNAEVPAKRSQDELHGPPIVTCKGWAIGDGESGKFLWGHNASERLHPASTTKIMTAYLVTCLAEQDPSILEETVTFSSRADNTGGSTSALKVGEQVSVGELLYGLLLPSGNDASVAFAEHFGARCKRQPNAAKNIRRENYADFIDAMNERAKHLGMQETTYANTHGLTADEHLTSPRDLLTLAYHAMQQPEFRLRTSTTRHGCRVQSTTGYERNIVWHNTNRMLTYKGFDGVKTGTTDAAGCCLVSRGERDGKRLIVVVLGAASSDSRYVDTRNLYRWAWNELAADQP